MSDVIRMARHAHHYLAVFDKGKALALVSHRRLASPGQRDRFVRQGPRVSGTGLRRAGYYCEVHHVIDYATCGTTDINQLAFGCGTNHTTVEPAAGPPAKTPAATPHGSHPHTSNAANPAPTPSTTPKSFSATRTTTKR